MQPNGRDDACDNELNVLALKLSMKCMVRLYVITILSATEGIFRNYILIMILRGPQFYQSFKVEQNRFISSNTKMNMFRRLI